MERLKEIVKDEIKEIEKHELSKSSIVVLGELIDILKGEGHDWDLLSTSALYKKELRKNTSKVEMIQSYLNASKKMYDVFKTNNHPAPGLSVIWSNPLCIPFLFLCRHTTELSIKYYLEKHNINFKSIHDIKSLYK